MEQQAFHYRDDPEYYYFARSMDDQGWTVAHLQRNVDGSISATWMRELPPRPGFWSIVGWIIYSIARLIFYVLLTIAMGAVIGAVVGLFLRPGIVEGLRYGSARGAGIGLYIAIASFGFGVIAVIFKALSGGYRT